MGIEVTPSEENFLEKVCTDNSLSSNNFFRRRRGEGEKLMLCSSYELQIGTYVGLEISFLDSNYTNDSIWYGYISKQNSKSSSDQKTNVKSLLPQ